MILAALLLLSAQDAASAPADLPPMTFGELHKTCLAGVGGDSGAIQKCQDFIYQVGQQLAYDEKNPGSCMAPANATIDQVTWAWLDDVSSRKTLPSDESPASDSVMSALLLTYPCGWVER